MGIPIIINTGGAISISGVINLESIYSMRVYARIMPRITAIPPRINNVPIYLEPYRRDMMYATAVSIDAGAILIEINCNNFGTGSIS